MVISATATSHRKLGIGKQNINNGVLRLSPPIKCIIWKNKLSDSEVEFLLRIFYKNFSKTYAKLWKVSSQFSKHGSNRNQ